MSYLCCLYWFTYSGFQHDLILLVTWRVSYNKQELLTLRKHLAMDSPRVFDGFLMGSVLLIALVFCVVVFGGVRVAHRFSILCCVFLVGSVLLIALVFCVVGLVGSVLLIAFVVCVTFSCFVCLRPVYLTTFLDYLILIASSVFSNVYYLWNNKWSIIFVDSLVK